MASLARFILSSKLDIHNNYPHHDPSSRFYSTIGFRGQPRSQAAVYAPDPIIIFKARTHPHHRTIFMTIFSLKTRSSNPYSHL